MANYFYDGMTNVNERLNQLYNAFAAGPYNALPLAGGTLTGQLTIDQRSSTSILALLGSDAPTYGAVILGYRGDTFHFAVGNESGLRGGNSNDLMLDALTNSIKFYAQSGGGTNPSMTIGGEAIVAARNVLPAVDNGITLGSAGLAYSVVYARTGAINTSDARMKRDFRDLTSTEIAAARDLARAIGVYRWRDAVECKGDCAREHIGPTVQRAIEIMQAHDLDPFNYGFICHDEWERETIEHAAVDDRPAVVGGLPAIKARAAYAEVIQEAGDRYAFRYDELAMFIAAGQEARLAALEAA